MTNRRTFLTALGASILTIGAGCASENPTNEKIMSGLENLTELKTENGEADVYRMVDREAGVVIYAGTYAEEGFEIIPISETDL